MVAETISTILGAYTTVALKNLGNLGPIKGSALATILFWPIATLSPLSLIYFFGGSFVGMTDQKILNPLLLFISCLLFPLIMQTTQQFISPLGGALGFSAFISVVLVSSVVRVFPQSRDRHI